MEHDPGTQRAAPDREIVVRRERLKEIGGIVAVDVSRDQEIENSVKDVGARRATGVLPRPHARDLGLETNNDVAAGRARLVNDLNLGVNVTLGFLTSLRGIGAVTVISGVIGIVGHVVGPGVDTVVAVITTAGGSSKGKRQQQCQELEQTRLFHADSPPGITDAGLICTLASSTATNGW